MGNTPGMRGFTVFELLLVALTGGILVSLLIALFTSGYRGVDRGTTGAQAQVIARKAMDQLLVDLRQGNPLPYQQDGRTIPISVLLPNAYDLTGGPYLQPQAANLLIVTQLADGAAVDTKSLNQYRYIAYRARNNVLQRFIYSVDNGTGTPSGITLTNGQWLLDPAFFANPGVQLLRRDTVVALPRLEDRIEFQLTHGPVSATAASLYDPDPGKLKLDPQLYTLTVTIRLYDLEELKKSPASRTPVRVNFTSSVRIEGTSN